MEFGVWNSFVRFVILQLVDVAAVKMFVANVAAFDTCERIDDVGVDAVAAASAASVSTIVVSIFAPWVIVAIAASAIDIEFIFHWDYLSIFCSNHTSIFANDKSQYKEKGQSTNAKPFDIQMSGCGTEKEWQTDRKRKNDSKIITNFSQIQF